MYSMYMYKFKEHHMNMVHEKSRHSLSGDGATRLALANPCKALCCLATQPG